MSWRWTGNPQGRPSAAAAATAMGAGAGEAIWRSMTAAPLASTYSTTPKAPTAVHGPGRATTPMRPRQWLANSEGKGPGEAVYAANDGGTVGLYLLR